VNVTVRVDDAASGEARAALVVPAGIIAEKLATIHALSGRLGKRLVLGVVADDVPKHSCANLDEVVVALCEV
jgi:hypothetical protein